MDDRGEMVRFGDLITQALEQVVEEELAAMPSEEELRERYGDLSALDRRMEDSIRKLQREERQEKRKQEKARRERGRLSLRKCKRIMIAVAILISMVFSMALASAQVRTMLYDMIIDWTEERMGLRYETESELLTALPEGYGPHYIPDGFEYVEENSVQTDYYRFYFYRTGDDDCRLSIQVKLLENAAIAWDDNESILYDVIEFDGVTAYLGMFRKHNGYTLVWTKDSIEHFIYAEGEIELSEIYKIAENIY